MSNDIGVILNQFAKQLNGREYGKELSSEEEKAAKAAGLLIVFGESNDLIKFRGIIHNERDLGGICEIYRSPPSWELVSCDEDDNPLCRRDFWFEFDYGATGWNYGLKPGVRHRRFDIFEDGEIYGVGLILHESDLHEFSVGEAVVKIGDYSIPGFVRAAFTLESGVIRYAVEHKAVGGGAFVHIYAGKNLRGSK